MPQGPKSPRLSSTLLPNNRKLSGGQKRVPPATLLAAFGSATYQMGACMILMVQKQTAKKNIAAAIVKPTCLRMEAS